MIQRPFKVAERGTITIDLKNYNGDLRVTFILNYFKLIIDRIGESRFVQHQNKLLASVMVSQASRKHSLIRSPI